MMSAALNTPQILRGHVQHYAWGGRHLIPALLQQPGGDQPWAELWFGSHEQGPTRVPGLQTTLRQLLADQPLPYLLKVLEVAECLSIQVHPDRQQAIEGFAREEAAGIPREAAERNYRDANHKPEVMVALTHCHLLYGFSEPSRILARLAPYPSLASLAHLLRRTGLETLYRRVLQLSLAERDTLLGPLLAQVIPAYEQDFWDQESHEFWLAKAAQQQGGRECRDPGLLLMLLMELLEVAPGEAIFQPARLPHAYLHGCNLELMANSDNVLRAGLTGKHVDSQALLEVVDITVRPPLRIQQLQLEAGCTSYPLPSAEFHLFHLHGQQSQWLPVHTGHGLLLNLGDAIHLAWPGGEIRCARGEALLIPPDCRCRLDGSGERHLYFAC